MTDDAKRLLIAVYRLTKGRTDVEVSQRDILNEVAREKLLSCSDDDFAAYKQRVHDEVDAFRASAS